MKEIVFASNNKGKIREVQEILNDYKILSLEEMGIDIDVEEDKDTFEGNAIKKAVEISKYLNGINHSYYYEDYNLRLLKADVQVSIQNTK